MYHRAKKTLSKGKLHGIVTSWIPFPQISVPKNLTIFTVWSFSVGKSKISANITLYKDILKKEYPCFILLQDTGNASFLGALGVAAGIAELFAIASPIGGLVATALSFLSTIFGLFGGSGGAPKESEEEMIKRSVGLDD